MSELSDYVAKLHGLRHQYRLLDYIDAWDPAILDVMKSRADVAQAAADLMMKVMVYGLKVETAEALWNAEVEKTEQLNGELVRTVGADSVNARPALEAAALLKEHADGPPVILKAMGEQATALGGIVQSFASELEIDIGTGTAGVDPVYQPMEIDVGATVDGQMVVYNAILEYIERIGGS